MLSRPRARGIRLPAWSATSRNGDFPPSLYTETGAGSSAASNFLGSSFIDAHDCGKNMHNIWPKKCMLWRCMLSQCMSPAYPLSWDGNADSQHQTRYGISL